MLTREEALQKHREMWTAMREALGDNPNPGERARFKIEWCETHGGADISAHCYLCQFVDERKLHCCDCPIDWGNNATFCFGEHVDYRFSPISKILALPEREVPNEDQS